MSADSATISLKDRLIVFAASAFIRLLRASIRLEHHGDGELRRMEGSGASFILAFWHRHLLLMPYSYRGSRMSVLISQHRDGELIARVMHSFGYDTSRGSSTRGGAAGFRDLLRKVRDGSQLGITPDGPKGPAGVVKPGTIQLAALAGVPILPVAMAASRAKRLRSWDRFIIPLPFSRVCFAYGEPMRVARDADVDVACAELGRRLDALETEAERRVA